jgi:uncharacterized membrane protein YphA (DoxX/SURF4 family)
MDQLNRRKMLIMGGTLGALGALGMATPAQAVPDPHWVWDEEADPLVASILDRGQVAEVNRLLRTWTRNDQPLPAGLPADLRAFIENARRLPPWADRAKLEVANSFVETKGTYLVLLYGLGGGILSTAIPNEARAVYYSKGGADLKDRAAKTGKLGYDVHELNAFRPDGHILVTAVKTRLVHAAVRHLLPQSPHWTGEIPISQNDMLVTWHTLPTYVMRKLTEWRVPVTPAQADAYLHVWQVTAHMLGIRDEYVPRTATTATATVVTAPASTVAGRVTAVVRVVMGLVFVWAFLDKMFGFGYATTAERAWVNGGSPTKGFLGGIDHGPFAEMFRGWAGAAWADWLFMLGLAGIGVALLVGVGLRIAAVSGTLMMLLMWAAEWPLDRFTDAGEPTMSTNPILDYHVLYALVLVWLAIVAAGTTWGLGKAWANLGLVKKNPWLR